MPQPAAPGCEPAPTWGGGDRPGVQSMDAGEPTPRCCCVAAYAALMAALEAAVFLRSAPHPAACEGGCSSRVLPESTAQLDMLDRHPPRITLVEDVSYGGTDPEEARP